MKKIIAFAAAAVAAVGMAFAAPVLNVHGYVGDLFFGTTINDFTSSDTQKMTLLDNLAYGGGAGLNFTLNGNIGIQPEVNYYYNNVGYKSTSTTSLNVLGVSYSNVTVANSIGSYSSLDIPVLVTYRYNKFNVCVGPYVSIPLSDIANTYNYTTTEQSGSDAAKTTTGSSTSDPTDISNAVLFGITGGIEYEERMGAGRLTFGARYLCDFTPVQYTTETTDSEGNKTTTTHDLFTRRALEVVVGYKMALKF